MNNSAGRQPFVDRTVGRAQSTGMPNGDHCTARDDSGESHHALACTEHRLARSRRQIDAAVPARPLVLGPFESAKDRGRPRRQRPDEAPARREPGDA
jgi:hypothetical protein